MQRTAELDETNRRLRVEMQEHALSEERFRQLAERSPDFICILDVAATFLTYANREFLLDRPIADLRDARAFLELTHPDDQQGATRYWQRLVNGDQRAAAVSFACLQVVVNGTGCKVVQRRWPGQQTVRLSRY